MEIEDRKDVGEEIGDAQKATSVHRVIAAMPVVVSYTAEIGTVRQLHKDGDVFFQWALWDKTPDGRPSRTWSTTRLDPFAVRNEFLAVRTERNALDFLRHNGDFNPLQDGVSWSEFQRWQQLVRIIQDRDGLIATQLYPDTPKSSDHVEVLKMFAGYPHQFFPTKPALLDSDIAEHDADIQYAIRDGERLREQHVRKLENWFVRPPTEIFWFPKMLTGAQKQRMTRGAVVPEFLALKEDLVPHLLIHAATALTAIAATLYADRVALIGSKVCPGCEKRFELEGPKDPRTYCKATCRETKKKARSRGRKRLQ